MKVLIVGSGGREHALAWKVAQSDRVERVYVAPGNAGTACEPKVENVAIVATDFRRLTEFAISNEIELTIVGPEVPLVDGIVDYFAERGLDCFGPNKKAAILEGSKTFTKDFLKRHKIPTAEYQGFADLEIAQAYVSSCTMPVVIKADGLAAGKGVVIANTVAEARTTLEDMLSGNVFGDAGHKVVIEEFLRGEEASFIIIADGLDYLVFASSQDHKAALNGDQGPNTGGMGAYSPAPVVDPEVHQRIIERVIEPTLKGMEKEGRRFRGFLYAGLMIDQYGNPKVIEFNCRFGDPETQPVMMRLESDLSMLCLAALRGELASHSISFSPRTALTVVMAAGGYPGDYGTGDEISGLTDINHESLYVFHAGTLLDDDSKVVTNGGRVLGVTALGDSVAEAQARAYQAINSISWQGAYYRTDIGYKAVARERA